LADHEHTLLLVEDEDPLRAFLVRVIEWDGFPVLPARDTADALQLLDEHHEAVCTMLLDLGLAEDGGVEAVRDVRQRHADVPLIVISPNPQRLVEALEVGATATLLKPFHTLDLLAAIRAQCPEPEHFEQPAHHREPEDEQAPAEWEPGLGRPWWRPGPRLS
jgi:two-component system alkaline phosphatase synthesis response regulator PhoP